MAKAAPSKQGAGSGRPPSTTPEVVHPAWLLKAFLLMVLVALVCGYLTLCGLFYRGQWQLVLHPSRRSVAPESVTGVPSELIHFGAAATGVPQLTGWWIPADAAGDYRHLTILYLRSGDGSLADDGAQLQLLHQVGASIFAIDYRGYGESADLHPNQQRMSGDARTAWEYLTGSRAIPAGRIIPYGRGLGAALALGLAHDHQQTPAVILDGPDFFVMDRVWKDPRAFLLPVRLLFHERFALRPDLDELHTPKLILSRGAMEDPAAMQAADPKMTVALPPKSTPAEYVHAMHRFLDQYAPPSPMPRLVPSPAPSQ